MSSNLKKGVFSSLLLVGNSVANKLIGLVSTLILARVLLPEDFGIVAIASLMVGFIEIMATTGSGQYLLRVDKLDEEKVDTAWTINLILKSLLSSIMLGLSFLIADYYDDPRLISVLICLTIIFFLHGFQNPGIIFLKRNQQYGRIVKLSVAAKIVSVIVAVTIALIYESYWALVAGKGTNAIIMVFGTNLVYPYKRKLMLKNTREQWRFSGWIIPQSMFSYFRTQLDTFIVSSMFGKSELGAYHTMKYVSYIPSGHFILPLSEPFLVELANAKNSINYFSKQLNASFLLLMLLGLPIATLMYFYHEAITLVLLGSNWVKHSYLISAFGLLIPAFIMLNNSKRVLIVYAKTKQIFFYEILAFFVVYGVLLLSGVDQIKDFAFLLVIMENIVAFMFFMYILLRYTSFKNMLQMIVASIPLILATIGALFVTHNVLPEIANPFWFLVVATSLYITSFALINCFLYLLVFKRLQEWEYLISLLTRTLKPLTKKFSR